VQEGERFRCVEYARVIHGALSSLGLQSRIVSLYRASPESTTKSHVVVEAYLPEAGRWVFVDGQWNAIPVLDGEPLNAVELQRAVARDAAGLSFYDQGPLRRYQRWIDDYLVYLSFNRDSRVGITRFRSKKIMLVSENLPVPRYATAWHAERDYRLGEEHESGAEPGRVLCPA
jgi:transglutaminase-like putative cysteine protease